MDLPIARLLPRPGPLWGPWPQRGSADGAPPWRGWHGLQPGGLAGMARRVAGRAAGRALDARRDQPVTPDELDALRRRLRRNGLDTDTAAAALAVAAAAAAATLGLTPRPTQLQAALALLDQRLAEMATGEGKTLAIALAAAVAALASVPVHVVTANDYLAARDAADLAPFYAALGLRVAARPGAPDEAARRAIYSADIVYATAKDLAFDQLRERQAGGDASACAVAAAHLAGQLLPDAVMRGLCWAFIDEADSILLDEADVPLILSRGVQQAARRAFLWQALALARRLRPGHDYLLHAADRHAALRPEGEERLAELTAGLGGPWQRPRYRREALQTALAALHLYRRDAHYLVHDGEVVVLDEVTGRAAPGRVWSRGLHTVIALKEGLTPPDETETVARTTFQRFFRRYWRLGGLSGTLWEARAELSAVYGLPVCRIPLHRSSCRKTLAPRVFNTPESLFDAAAARADALAATGRPVLVGTDSVAAAEAVAARLAACGRAHHVLHARQDADEAAVVAAAGCAGQVTVATRMAGRGTDITLDAAALAAGGLHVLNCQHNPSQRLDRQLAGRAARHGEPGSVEHWRCRLADAAANASQEPTRVADKEGPWKKTKLHWISCQLMALSLRWQQWCEERRRAALRAALVAQDRDAEGRLAFSVPPD